MGINDEINYNWPYVWDENGMGNPRPIVNRLLKAMIEKDVEEMKRLFSLGATIDKIDEATFQRALFHLLDDYSVIECLIEHGFVGAYGTYRHYQKCIEPETYFWGILARAWYLGNYDVFELLAKSGFDEMYICSKGEGYYGEELIIKKNDVRAAKIMLENGYSRRAFEEYTNRYPQSKVIQYLQSNPIIYRKSFMLDPFKFKSIPRPILEKEGLFNRKKVQERNRLLLEDYNDRVLAQKKFIEFIGADKWHSIVNGEKESEAVMIQAMDDILKNGF